MNERHRCTYISNITHECVHRVALSDATVTQWPVNDRPMGLTVTVTHAVLVTCIIVRKVIEFSTDAQLLHVLTLPQDVIVTEWPVNDRPMGLTVTVTHLSLIHI